MQRYCLLHIVVQRPKSFNGLVNSSLRCMVAELRGIKFAQFFGFWPIFPYKLLKRTFRWPGYSPVVTSQNDSDFSIGIRRSKGVPSGTGDFLRLVRGAGDPQTCPNFRLWQMAIPTHNATTQDVRSGPKMSAKRACSPKQLLVHKCFVWNSMPNMLSRFHLIPERDGQTDGRTVLLYAYCTSSWIILWLMTLPADYVNHLTRQTVRSCTDYVVKQLVSRLAHST